jgi:hypothetical protein
VSAAASAATINPSTYLTVSTAATTYAPIAAGQPTSGTVGQVLTKNSGTNYDSSWATLIPGDRYLTSSTTSLVIDNANKTLTVGTGLSYTSQQDVVIAYDAANHMHAQVLTYNSGTGVMTVDVRTHTGSGTYSAWTVNVGGTVPLQSIVWGDILGTLGNQSDLATALNNKLETSTAASTYAPLASPALTGNVTITSNSTGAALFIEQAGTGNILTLHDQTTDTNFVAIDANGKVNTIASEATNGAGFNVPHGVAPTTPVNGDIWTTTTDLAVRLNGSTRLMVNVDGTQTINGSKTFSNASQTLGNSTAAGTINIGSGATISGSTRTINIGTGSAAGSTNNINIGGGSGTITTTLNGTTNFTGPITGAINNITLGNGTAASTFNLFTGATVSGSTKTVAIATGGLAGSTTNVTIGSTTGTSTTTLQGTTNGVTEAVDTNNTELATTAFVVGQAGSATPLANGTAAVGTSLRYARQDHVHGTDTTRAPLASPSLTGTPLSTTAAVDTNTTQIATTAYVMGQGYAKLASPSFTGTPSLPTGTIGTTQSPGDNSTALATTAFVTAAVPAFATETQAIYGTSSTTAISPLLMRYILANPMLTTYNSLVGNYSSFVSGSGAISSVWSNLFAVQITAANGKAAFQPNSQVSYHSIQSRGKPELTVDWTKPMWFSFRFCYSAASTIGNSNTVNRVTIGKVTSTFGDLAARGFGVTWTAGTTGAFTVSAHNGTTLSSSASAVTVSNTTYFPSTSSAADFMVYSDGTGNVTLYCNNVQVATTTGGPSSGTSPGPRFVFETDNTTSTSGTVTCDYTGVKSMLAY